MRPNALINVNKLNL